MFNHPPTLPYSGLTIILNKPSRFDTKRLISGNAGDSFDRLISPLTRSSCDIKLAIDKPSLLPNTRVCLLLGQESLDLIKPNASLLTYRGSPIILDNVIYIPTLSPQDSNDRKNYEDPEEEDEPKEDKESEKDYQKTSRKNFKFWNAADIKKAIRILREGPHVYPKYKVNYCPSPEHIINLLTNHKNGYLVIDIETDQNLNITCFSFLWASLNPLIEHEIFVVPFKRFDNSLFYSKIDYCHIFRALAIAFKDNTVVGHNLSFDLFVLLFKYLVNTPLKVYDTMIAHHRCHPEVEKSLGHCVSYYLDLPYHKDEGAFNPHNNAQELQLWTYNAKDVWTTFLLFVEQQKEISKLKAESSVIQANKAVRSFQMMQFEGMNCDVQKLCQIVDNNDAKFEQYQRILKLLTKRSFNPRSSQQVIKYYYEELGFKKPTNDPTKEENLLKLYVKKQTPSLRVVLAARGAGKEASSLRKIRLWKDNRITSAFKITGTETFRPSSSELLGFKGNKKLGITKTKGYGTNVQNWNKHIRECITAKPGYKLLQLDQAGAEALVVAYLCRYARFRSLFLNKIKPHTYVAMHIAPKVWSEKLGLPDIEEYLRSPISELKNLKYWGDLAKLIADSDSESNPQKRFYYIGKTCCHLLNYDAQWAQFQITSLVKSEGTLAFTDEQAKYYRNLYRDKLFPELTDWHAETVRLLYANNRVLFNLFGFPREFGGAFDRETFKQAYAHVPQSTIGCLTIIAQTEITERLDQREPILDGVSIWQNGFDSLLFHVPEEKVLEVAKTLIPHMARKITSPKGEEFQMGVGVQIGDNWGIKNNKNPSGLDEIKIAL